MQKNSNYSLPHGGSVELSYDGEFVHIESRIANLSKDGLPRLNVCTQTGKRLCLGSFGKHNGEMHLGKSYPVSYFEANDIFIDDISHFYVSDVDIRNEKERVGEDLDSINSGNNTADEALERAKNILNSLPGEMDWHEEAKITRERINSLFDNSFTVEFPEIKGFSWIEINDIRNTFELSILEHIVFNEFFVRAFVKSGKWYFGKSASDGFYAVCIYCNINDPNPMVNALDCVNEYCDNAKGVRQIVVGIGIFDDGQYFYKIED